MGAVLYQTRKRTIALIVALGKSLELFPSVASFPTCVQRFGAMQR